MARLLEGIAKTVAAAFKGRLQAGRLYRQTATGGLDVNGDPVGSTTTSWPCEGFSDSYDDAFRARAGIPMEDVKVSIFGGNLPTGIRPQKDDIASLAIHGVTTFYQLRGAQTDPALALWTCQAFVIPDPLLSM